MPGWVEGAGGRRLIVETVKGVGLVCRRVPRFLSLLRVLKIAGDPLALQTDLLNHVVTGGKGLADGGQGRAGAGARGSTSARRRMRLQPPGRLRGDPAAREGWHCAQGGGPGRGGGRAAAAGHVGEGVGVLGARQDPGK